ncbi:5-deoxy-glucuronate isomerase [Jeotgalibacillus proteolyticus]|uniref:5-deoxy-glucuronate isomerase n=1 Tax=Jeotgalibacillus proteolyticus TaxID=2082395 RepID=A0A2S5G874_9BACL|nr:5-deoxy-glucuronate isomerase [Jeotgalibacillus proteolyticus]PPA69192.1 5-deoxy-glucuronate isomerase [Jeotgalibacillus proteolyticus]
MVNLLYKKGDKKISNGVTVIQDLGKSTTGLDYVQFKVIEMDEGAQYEEALENTELCAVVLTGKVDVTVDGEDYKDLGTRDSVFEKIPTDSIYVPSTKTFKVKSNTRVKLALCYSNSTKVLDTKVIRAKDNDIEHRGQYANQRLVHNILPDYMDVPENLLVVEVYTDSGNFSSYPPHKHDQDNLPEESFLEETYYHEIDPKQGFVFQRVYTDERDIDETMAVEHQDCVSVPKGYHPVGVPDGYNLYYLNVMAGPKRKWKFNNDKDHEWILERD